jgi:hypothetical protein
MWKPLLMAAALTVTGPAYAQTATEKAQTTGKAQTTKDFSFRDDNNDGIVTRDEFNRRVGDVGVFGKWDADRSGMIDEREFNEIGFDEGFGDFDTWDVDDNRYLNETELNDGIYKGFDENENGHWDGNEWDDAGDAGFWDI